MKKKLKKGLIGGGGHTREVLSQIGSIVDVFVDDNFYNIDSGFYKLSDFDPDEYEVLITVGDPKIREKIRNTLPKNTKYFIFIHPTAQIMSKDVEIGEGSFIGANSIITTNVKIGKHSILNRGCQIGHDTVCGDFLSMMPGSIISGNCKLRNRVYLGTNSSIREKITICNDVTIGLNTGVVKDINEKGVYVGSPAKKLIKKCEKI